MSDDDRSQADILAIAWRSSEHAEFCRVMHDERRKQLHRRTQISKILLAIGANGSLVALVLGVFWAQLVLAAVVAVGTALTAAFSMESRLYALEDVSREWKALAHEYFVLALEARDKKAKAFTLRSLKRREATNSHRYPGGWSAKAEDEEGKAVHDRYLEMAHDHGVAGQLRLIPPSDVEEG